MLDRNGKKGRAEKSDTPAGHGRRVAHDPAQQCNTRDVGRQRHRGEQPKIPLVVPRNKRHQRCVKKRRCSRLNPPLIKPQVGLGRAALSCRQPRLRQGALRRQPYSLLAADSIDSMFVKVQIRISTALNHLPEREVVEPVHPQGGLPGTPHGGQCHDVRHADRTSDEGVSLGGPTPLTYIHAKRFLGW